MLLTILLQKLSNICQRHMVYKWLRILRQATESTCLLDSLYSSEPPKCLNIFLSNSLYKLERLCCRKICLEHR